MMPTKRQYWYGVDPKAAQHVIIMHLYGSMTVHLSHPYHLVVIFPFLFFDKPVPNIQSFFHSPMLLLQRSKN